jgi:oligopeptide/dipeptide ABC transporter ATP-binding protein
MRVVRRTQIAMIFQDPSNFLNPVLTVGEQIGEGIGLKRSARETKSRVISALRSVRISEPERVIDYYPFQMSGGMQQRAVIAAAVVRQPALIIADEPTTALDATVQYQILRLLGELQAATRTSLILISHDLAVIASVCSRVYVMYAGEIVESGSVSQIYRSPSHPYTEGLLSSILDPLDKRPLKVMPGSLPDLMSPPPGCRFHPRCPRAMSICSKREPPMLEVANGHTARCWLHAPQPTRSQ